ncbi:MAG TPA: PhzF family phenazine biosynthesis protein [Gemmatales bacterium]|nr:PhzF family phenazine biosynthesis protein [Gemmatales bacterium]HMP60300.1 PhzF family phenazine biosynthesis protein [Gemmatales bacterium]
MPVPCLLVDSFATQPFRGNPAAVCLLAGTADTAWLQSVAMEFNQSETAFLYPKNDGFHLRWFTPVMEVDLCGHATLAAAHTLWELGRVKRDQVIKFYTRSGLLTAAPIGDLIELDFPAEPPEPTPPPANLKLALGGISPVFVAKNRFDLMVELETEAEVRELQPLQSIVESLPHRGLLVTAPASTPDIDFVARFFAPQSGVPEDPVTGSAYCCLGPYWQKKSGKYELTAYQASARGGFVRIRVAGTRVYLAGQAVTVAKVQLLSGKGMDLRSS